MLTQDLRKIFNRDLTKLQSEIGLYKSEGNLWKVAQAIPNSGGNLCLHLVGNLNAYIGAQLGKTGYIRHRDLEFSQKNVPQAELLRMIEDTRAVVDKVMSTLRESVLDEIYPEVVLKEATTTRYFVVHLAVHLGYHLGQINYHRRLLDL
jgi:hypothetical protein